jgi:large subunit ribosomal protein L1
LTEANNLHPETIEMPKRGKKYNDARKLVEPGKEYSLEEAAELVKKTSTTKFDSSVDMDVRLGVDPRQADQMVRGNVSLPHGIGKDVRVLALVNPAKQDEAREAGADHVGLDDYIEKIEGGWTDIDVIVATPDVMGKLGKLGRVLGPRGLMPNPKSGTVTMEVGNAVKEVKAGKIDFRVDKFGILHTSIGKASFDAQKIKENAEAFLQTVTKLKPASAKGVYIRGVCISSTMGPGIPISRSSIAK